MPAGHRYRSKNACRLAVIRRTTDCTASVGLITWSGCGNEVRMTGRGLDTNKPSMIYSITSHQSIVPNMSKALYRAEQVMCFGEGKAAVVDASQKGMQLCLDGANK